MKPRVNKKYQSFRIRLILKGLTLRQWAGERGYPASTVYDAAKGNRNGVESVKIVSELEVFCNG